MKRIRLTWILSLVLLTACFSGCVQPLPPGVKEALYTAQLSLKHTVSDAAKAEESIWVVDKTQTLERQLTQAEIQVTILLKIMEQAEKNLVTVSDYFRTGAE